MKKVFTVVLAVLSIAALIVSCDSAASDKLFSSAKDMGCFRFEAERDNTSITFKKAGTPVDVKLIYSTDGSQWHTLVCDDNITLDAGESGLIKAGKLLDGAVVEVENVTFSKDESNYYYFNTNNVPVAAKGNIMFLLKSNPSDLDTVPAYAFYKLTSGALLSQAPVLPATKLGKYCYAYMFADCRFEKAPELPATELKEGCYLGMFKDCKVLEEATLTDAELVLDCYNSMFVGCTNLRKLTVGFEDFANGTTHWLDSTTPEIATLVCPEELWQATDCVSGGTGNKVPNVWRVVNN